jgi:hypothetical protein
MSVAIEPLHATLASASEQVSVERWCNRAVQLRMHVLTAAEHAVQASASVGGSGERVLRVCCGRGTWRPPMSVAILSHRMRRL